MVKHLFWWIPTKISKSVMIQATLIGYIHKNNFISFLVVNMGGIRNTHSREYVSSSTVTHISGTR